MVPHVRLDAARNPAPPFPSPELYAPAPRSKCLWQAEFVFFAMIWERIRLIGVLSLPQVEYRLALED